MPTEQEGKGVYELDNPQNSPPARHDSPSNSSNTAKDDDEDQLYQRQPRKETRYLKPDSLIHEIALVTLICIAQIIVQAGLAQALSILHIIGPSFGSSTPELTWYVSAYSLTAGTFILFAGRLGDIYGHKKVFVLGILWFALWSMFAGVAAYSNQIFFDCCRALQGSGAAVIMPNAAALLGRTYPPGPRKAMSMSLFGACAPNGFILGAVFSGIFAQLAWWPWTFWTCAILSVFLAGASCWIIPSLDEDPNDLNLVRTKSKNIVAQKMEELDVFGAITGVSALILINFAWNQGPVVGWDVPYNYVLLIVGFIVLAFFFYIELRWALNPLVPVKKIGFDSAFALGCISAGWASFGIWVYYLWQLWEVFRRLSPLESTAQLVPAGISGAIAAVTTGMIVMKISPGWVMLAAMCAFAVGNILLATAPVEQTYWAQTFVATIVTPWGMDMSFPSGIIILSDAMPADEQGTAASLVTTIQNYSIAIGLGVAGTIEVYLERDGLSPLETFRGPWYAAIGMDVVGIIVALAFTILSLNRRRKLSSGTAMEPEKSKVNSAA